MLIRVACFVLGFLLMFCLSEFQFRYGAAIRASLLQVPKHMHDHVVVAAVFRDLRVVDRRLLGSGVCRHTKLACHTASLCEHSCKQLLV